jgi:hypothetical protein
MVIAQDRTLDWIPNYDERNELFRFAALDCFAGGKAFKNITRNKTIFLDQGQEGACTGFGEEHVRALTPYARVVTTDTARAVYAEARRQDEWPGEDYEGSSVNGAMKAARLMGFITRWHWCKTIAELKHALSYHGAVEAGTDWLDGMWEPDEDGFLTVGGSVVGGHAYAISGYKTMPNGRIAFRMENSWGTTWGQYGGAWIWEDDMQALLDARGEFACPSKVR